MQQVAHAEGLLHVLVTVSVGDAALGGAELCAGLGQTCLFQTVLIDMVGHGDGGAVRDLQVGRGDGDTLLAQLVDLTVQMVGVDDHTVAHHADNIGTEDTGGQQIQHELAPLVLDGMTSIVAALIACNNIVLLADQVDHAALASSPQLIPVIAVSIINDLFIVFQKAAFSAHPARDTPPWETCFLPRSSCRSTQQLEYKYSTLSPTKKEEKAVLYDFFSRFSSFCSLCGWCRPAP